jgi:hypothetical protein
MQIRIVRNGRKWTFFLICRKSHGVSLDKISFEVPRFFRGIKGAVLKHAQVLLVAPY